MSFDAVKTWLSLSDYKSEIPPVVSLLDSKDSLSEHIKKCQKTIVSWAFQHLSMWVSVGIGNVYFQVRSWWIPAKILARIQLPWIKPFFSILLLTLNTPWKYFQIVYSFTRSTGKPASCTALCSAQWISAA